MKKYILPITVMTVCIVLLACNKYDTSHPTAPTGSKGGSHNKIQSIPSLTSKADTKALLDTIARTIAQSRSWINNNLLDTLYEGPVPVSHIDTSVTRYATFDTATMVVKFEMINRSTNLVLKNNSNAIFGICADPDRAYVVDTLSPSTYTINVYRNGAADTTIVLPHITDDDSTGTDRDNAIAAFPYPLFDVTIEQSSDELPPTEEGVFGKLKTNSVQTTTYPLYIHSVELKVKEDNSNEEFEMIGNDWIAGSPSLAKTTTFKMNSIARFDGSDSRGTQHFPDVNQKQTYSISPRMPLISMEYNSNPRFLLAYEDDVNAGINETLSGISYCGYFTASGYTNSWLNNYGKTDQVQWYDCANNSRYNGNVYFQMSGNSFFGDNDDLYRWSGVKNITYQNVTARMGGSSSFNTNQSGGGGLPCANYVFSN